LNYGTSKLVTVFMHASLHFQGYKVVSLLSFDGCVRSESWSSYKENIFIAIKM